MYLVLVNITQDRPKDVAHTCILILIGDSELIDHPNQGEEGKAQGRNGVEHMKD